MANDDVRTGTADFRAAVTANLRATARGSITPKAIPKSVRDSVYGDNGDTLFGPGVPLEPVDQQPVRIVDFAPNVNLNRHARALEGFSFEQLRAFANVELIRLAIETRKEQIEALDWGIQLRDPKKGEKSEDTDAAKSLVEFFRKPDGVTEFSTWVRMLLEEMLVLDALSLERQKTRSGKLAALLPVPGHTIHPMVDTTGRRPAGKDVVAYQQIIKGRVWANLTADDLIYAPRNPRPGKIYGFGPVEQVIVTIQTVLARQTAQLGYFTDGNIPAGILTGPEGWNASQLESLQNMFNEALRGRSDHKGQVLWVPFGSKYQAFKEAPLKDEFDEWLARIVCYAFNLPPTAFIKQMNRSTASNDTERGAEEGLMPVKLWLKRQFDRIIGEDLGQPDYEWVWIDKTETDPEKQAKVDDLYLRNGSLTINEVRMRLGYKPIDGGDVQLIYSPSGVLPLDVLLAAPPPQQGGPAPGAGGASTAQQPKTPASPNGPKGPTQQAKSPQSQQAKKLAKAGERKLPVVSADRPLARRRAADISNAAHSALRKAAGEVGSHLERQLRGMHKAITLDGVNTDPYDILNEGDDDQAKAKAKAKQLADTVPLGSLAALALAVRPAMLALAQDSASQQFGATGGVLTDDVNGEIAQDAADYADQRSAELVEPGADTGIVDSTRNMIGAAILAGLLSGSSADDIADAVMDSYAFSFDRADQIGDMESRLANGAGVKSGATLAANLMGLQLGKEWQTAGDDKVEEVCLANEAEGAIPLDQPFSSGDDMSPAHNHCRCEVAIVILPAAPAA